MQISDAHQNPEDSICVEANVDHKIGWTNHNPNKNPHKKRSNLVQVNIFILHVLKLLDAGLKLFHMVFIFTLGNPPIII